MLWHCPETRRFLIHVQEYLLERNTDIRFNEISFIFNIGKATQGDLTFYLKLKEYIFTSKFHKKTHSTSVAINRFIQHYTLLKHQYTVNEKGKTFNKDWEKYQHLFNSQNHVN